VERRGVGVLLAPVMLVLLLGSNTAGRAHAAGGFRDTSPADTSFRRLRQDAWGAKLGLVSHAARAPWTGPPPRATQLEALPTSQLVSTAASSTTLDPVADSNLPGANGNVLGLVRSGSTLYIAGSFRSVGQASGGFVPLDGHAGAVLHPFPKINGEVLTAVPDGAGGLYIGGDFTAVGGQPRSCVAQIASDGSVTPWNPRVGGTLGFIPPPGVAAIAVSGSHVYIGGVFQSIGGQSHLSLGCVDARTGAVEDRNLDTDPNGYVFSLASVDTLVLAGGWFKSIAGQPHNSLAAISARSGDVTPWNIDAAGNVLTLASYGDTVFVGGDFGWIAGQDRTFLAALDVHDHSVLPFDAQADFVYLPGFALPAVRALAMVGDTLFVGGGFTKIGGEALPSLAALDIRTATALAWMPPVLGPLYQGLAQTCYAIAVTDSTVYFGGSFDFVGSAYRPCAAAVDRRTGKVTNWAPNPDLPVRSLTVRDSVIFAGGEFSLIGDWIHRAGLAAINAFTGELKPWNPNPNGSLVTAIAVDGDRVLVSGDFTEIGGDPQRRSCLAAVDTLGGLATDWNPSVDGPANSMILLGNSLFLGGLFTTVGGQPRNNLAAVDVSTGQVLPWDPEANEMVSSMASDGGVIFVGGLFDQIGGQPRGGIAAVDTAAGLATDWNPGTDNNTVDALLAVGDKLYVGGGFGAIGGQPRNAIAVLDARSGIALPWSPEVAGWNEPVRVRALVLADSQLVVGGNFGGMGGQSRICLAAVDTATALATSWDPDLDGYVWSLLQAGSTLYVGGGFSRAGGLPADGLAGFAVPSPQPRPPSVLGLAQCVPNPVRSVAEIRFDLPSAAPVTLAVYDLQGRRVATPLNRQALNAGAHATRIQIGKLPAGVYLYRLEADGRTATRKMVVLQ